ncbi:MAG: HU family DNA-binding protein [Candidatus Hydrogenedentota bacterium]|nr:MAG: HU family DNA-binding protein [Candidatus Hydrogenedentota bacterium]
MIKEDVVEGIAEELDVPKQEGQDIVEQIIDSIKDILETDGKIEIRGFGTFRAVMRKPKLGRIIATGETVPIPARRVPKFIPGRILKELVNERGLEEEGSASGEGVFE